MRLGTGDAEEEDEQAEHGKHYEYAEKEFAGKEFSSHGYSSKWLLSYFKRPVGSGKFRTSLWPVTAINGSRCFL